MTFHNRFFPATMRARQLLDEGDLGKILEFRAAYLHGGNASPETPVKWKLTAAAGGGVIADLASHVIDLVDWLVGPFGSVSAMTQIAYAERPSAADPARKVPVDAEDCVMVLAKMRSGAVGTIEATKIAVGAEDELRLEIHGARGGPLQPHGPAPPGLLRCDRQRPAARRLAGMEPHRLRAALSAAGRGFPSPKAAIGWIRGHVACLANFLSAVAEGRPAAPGLEQGIRVQHLMECLRQSAAGGHWVAAE